MVKNVSSYSSIRQKDVRGKMKPRYRKRKASETVRS